jgi:hypothetical protein
MDKASKGKKCCLIITRCCQTPLIANGNRINAAICQRQYDIVIGGIDVLMARANTKLADQKKVAITNKIYA